MKNHWLNKKDVCQVIKRKFRWTVEFIDQTNKTLVNRQFVKPNSRPNISDSCIPRYQPLNLTFWGTQEELESFLQRNCEKPFKFTTRLELYDGCGELLETWILTDCFLDRYELTVHSEIDKTKLDISYFRCHYKNNSSYYGNGLNIS